MTDDTLFLAWLSELGTKNLPQALQLAFVRSLWLALHSALPNLPVPQAGSSGEEDEILCCVWDKSEHHLDVEINAQGLHDWFYCNRVTKEAVCFETSGPEITEKLLDKIQRFV